jgi:hypothetical protein
MPANDDSGFEAWLDRMVRATDAWDHQRFDELDAIDLEAGLGLDRIARLVTTFCERSGELPDRIGRDTTGRLIWYLMGGGRQIWFDAQRASPALAQAAILSIGELYERLFAVHLRDPSDGTTAVAHPLGTACYMLWDMSGGLTTILYQGKPPNLIDPCFEVLDRALGLQSPACWLSALHALGHVASDYPDRVAALIDGFERRHARTVSPTLSAYADAARRGLVQ